MKAVALIINSFLYAMMIAVTIFGSVWLEMRVNIGWILFIAWALFGVLGYYFTRAKTQRISRSFTLITYTIAFVYSFLLLGWQRLAIVPAAIIREGIGMTKLPFLTINIVLLALLGTALFLLLLFNKSEPKIKRS